MRSIGRPDFAQNRAALGHHIGQSKRSANLDHLAARHYHFASLGERVEREHDGGGVVVDDGSRLGASQCANLVLYDRVAVAARACLEIVFQVDRRPRRRHDGFDRRFSQNRAPEIRMQHDAGRIDDRPEHRLVGGSRMRGGAHDGIDHRVAIARMGVASGENCGAQFRLRPLHHDFEVAAAESGNAGFASAALRQSSIGGSARIRFRARISIGVTSFSRVFRQPPFPRGREQPQKRSYQTCHSAVFHWCRGHPAQGA